MPSDRGTLSEAKRVFDVSKKTKFGSQSPPCCALKWSVKFGQLAMMYPTRTNGYENDKARKFSDKFKDAVVFEALRGDKTVQ